MSTPEPLKSEKANTPSTDPLVKTLLDDAKTYRQEIQKAQIIIAALESQIKCKEQKIVQLYEERSREKEDADYYEERTMERTDEIDQIRKENKQLKTKISALETLKAEREKTDLENKKFRENLDKEIQKIEKAALVVEKMKAELIKTEGTIVDNLKLELEKIKKENNEKLKQQELVIVDIQRKNWKLKKKLAQKKKSLKDTYAKLEKFNKKDDSDALFKELSVTKDALKKNEESTNDLKVIIEDLKKENQRLNLLLDKTKERLNRFKGVKDAARDQNAFLSKKVKILNNQLTVADRALKIVSSATTVFHETSSPTLLHQFIPLQVVASPAYSNTYVPREAIATGTSAIANTASTATNLNVTPTQPQSQPMLPQYHTTAPQQYTPNAANSLPTALKPPKTLTRNKFVEQKKT